MHGNHLIIQGKVHRSTSHCCEIFQSKSWAADIFIVKILTHERMLA